MQTTQKIMVGDMRERLLDLPEESIHACVTDPPYELGFMGKSWDKSGVAFDPETWRAVYRVLKPGAHLLAFGGTRTVHRIACAIEDAGFEIRDQIAWMYGSGFPKSMDVSKAIDKAAGAEREDKFEGSFDRRSGPTGNKRCDVCGKWLISGSPCKCPRPQDEPQSDAARQWDGWGTALKPAHEPIIVARKPFRGTVANCVLQHGTGGINVDACRVEGAYKWRASDSNEFGGSSFQNGSFGEGPNQLGRWPANVCLDEDAAAMLDAQSGDRKAGGKVRGSEPSRTGQNGIYGAWGRVENEIYGDTGGASRFFYTAKASRAERSAGLTERNVHPTVKPIDLMEWLVRLVTPPGGTVLDPFLGSGTTLIAAAINVFNGIGVELDPNSTDIAVRRINGNAGLLTNVEVTW